MKHKLSIMTLSLVFGAIPVFSTLGITQRGNAESAAENRQNARVMRQQAEERAQQSVDVNEKVQQIKQEVEARRTTIRREVCERRQARLSTALPRLATGATSVKTAIDSVYDRVQGFYESGQLTVSNYEELIDGIELAKAESETSLQVIAEYQFQLSCDDPDVGDQLMSYRLAIVGARESLKDYRRALVELISALRSEAASASDSVDENRLGEEEEQNEE